MKGLNEPRSQTAALMPDKDFSVFIFIDLAYPANRLAFTVRYRPKGVIRSAFTSDIVLLLLFIPIAHVETL